MVCKSNKSLWQMWGLKEIENLSSKKQFLVQLTNH